MKKNVPFVFTKGIDRSATPHQSDLGSFYNLKNVRLSPDNVGQLEQTPYFDLFTTLAQGTYWTGGASATEPTTSAVRGIIRDIYVTDYVYYASSTQVQAFQQNIQPSSETINTGCLIVINNVAGLGITLGNTIDIVIDGATTFKWRKNGGAYTTLIPITTSGVSIDGGNATVYFLTSTGFTVNDTWSWTRTDCSVDFEAGALATRSTKPTDWSYYKGTLYFRNNNGRIMACKWATGNSARYVITAGYRAIYGDTITFFDDHMIIGRYSKTSQTITTLPKAKTVGWSDKTDVENFIPTDTNEADQYVVPNVVQRDIVITTASDSNVESVSVIGQQLFVFTTYEIYYSPALGLPDVFSFTKFLDMPTTDTSTASIIEAVGKVYIWTQSGIFTFNGTTLDYIGGPVKPLFYLSSISRSRSLDSPKAGYYMKNMQEVYFYVNNTGTSPSPFLLVYSEVTKSFYTRGADFSNDSQPVTCVSDGGGGSVWIGGVSRKVFSESNWQASPVFDSTDGTAYTTPTITFQVMSQGTLRYTKEVESVYIGAYIDPDASSSVFSSGSNCKVDIAYRDCPVGLISGSSTVLSNATWDSSLPDGLVSPPRQMFRGISFELQLRGADGTKPPGKAYITAFEPLITLPQELEEL